MDRVVTFSLQDDFLHKLADFIENNFLRQNRDISRIAFVFGGRRPALFLKREFARRIKKSFFPPTFFSIDEFMKYIVSKKERFTLISELDARYAIYNLARQACPQILKGREKFSLFLPWAGEISGFIEQLDLEDIRVSSLENIQLKASIGYDVPPSINALLEHIIVIRDRFHDLLKQKKTYSRGLIYLLAAGYIGEVDFSEFEKVIFCNFFYLHKTEERVIRDIYEKLKALLFFQGEQKDWSVLKRLSEVFSCQISPAISRPKDYRLNLYCGFDTHAQVVLVAEALKKIKNLDKTVIVLPEPANIIPLLSEISALTEEFNVSMGYPLQRSALYSLFSLIFKAQATKKGRDYYARDYLRVLGHPLVKNLKITDNPAATRVLVHKIEEILIGEEQSVLSGSLFINLKDLQDLRALYELSALTLKKMEIEINFSELQLILCALHNHLFYSWEDISNFSQLSLTLEKFLDCLVHKSPLALYPLNLKITEKIFSLKDELKHATFQQEEFPKEEIFKIFANHLEAEVVSFSGSPLKGLQILGLFETRSLNFENVIVMDAHESALPKLRIYEPLIPREVTVALGIDRLEKEEEIQRYQFMRLISAAENVHLVYEESKDKQKSRFIEELLWEEQKRQTSLEVISIPRPGFRVQVLPKKMEIEKSPQIIQFLQGHTYSASSIDTYLRCPLQFYYHYVLGLEEKKDLAEAPEGSDIGNFLHGFLEKTFKNFLGLRPRIDAKFKEYFLQNLEEEFNQQLKRKMKSESFLVKEIIRFRMERFLEAEAKREIKELLWVEKALECPLKLGKGSFNFQARIDRIDRLGDASLLIIDYKTGSDDPLPKTREKVETMEFSRENIKNSIKSFQLPLYFYFVRKHFKEEPLNVGLYYLRTSELRTFIKAQDLAQGDKVMAIFLPPLEFVMNEILNPQIRFQADDSDPYLCSRCTYFYLCR